MSTVGERATFSRWRSRLSVAAVALVVTLVWPATAAGEPATQVNSTECERTVVLVHDVVSNAAAFNSLERRLAADGMCVFAFEYGHNGISALTRTLVGEPIAGLTRIEDNTSDFAAYMATLRRSTGVADVDVVAHGAGSLLVQRYLQQAAGDSGIRSLVTVGPMWNGTNVAGLGTIEDFSRRIGTYDTILALETPIVDPLCSSCREIVTGSDFLRNLHDGGLVSAGVRYTNIISDLDLLVIPPISADIPGMTLVRLQESHPLDFANHFTMLDDPDVQSAVLGALDG